jgi:transcriptional regulator with XRE-family HTH domain
MDYTLKSRIVLKFGTQEDFAAAINERPEYVSQIVRGRRKISPEKKLQWADALNCSTDEIFDM